MGITKEQLIQTLELSKTYEDGELTAVETRLNALIQALYEVVNNNREDPIHEIHENVGLQDTPVGHIMAYMGRTAPKNYLVCDGSVYNITEYPALSSHILNEFGAVNYFGGDGETTFAVPDLRNEFLRGYHGEKEEQLSGDIGKHQPATAHHRLITAVTGGGTKYLQIPMSGFSDSTDADTTVNPSRTYMNINASTYDAYSNNASNGRFITSRPTNVAVLYCIKYHPTYYLRAGSDRDYFSKEEQCIGTWINGKLLYRVVLTGTLPKGTTSTMVPSGSYFGEYPTDIDEIVDMYGFSGNPSTGQPQHPIPYVHTSSAGLFGFHVNFESGSLSIGILLGSNWSNDAHKIHLVIVYTKKTYYVFLGIAILIPIRHLCFTRRKPNGN